MSQEAVEHKGPGAGAQIYLKAFPLRSTEDVQKIKDDVARKTIIILRVTPLAQRDIEELRRAVEELYKYCEKIGGDIARLGEERIVITPPGVKIWRGLL